MMYTLYKYSIMIGFTIISVDVSLIGTVVYLGYKRSTTVVHDIEKHEYGCVYFIERLEAYTVLVLITKRIRSCVLHRPIRGGGGSPGGGSI